MGSADFSWEQKRGIITTAKNSESTQSTRSLELVGRRGRELTSFLVPSLGSMGSNWDGDNEYDTFPMASTTRRWTSSN
jgi:hypothetical protein